MTPVSEPRSRRSLQREAQKAATRARLFEAALQLFRRDGVQQAALDEIGRLAGVSRATFYFHFPTREAVLDELLARASQRVADAVEALPAGASVRAVVEALGSEAQALWQAEPGLLPEALRRGLPLGEADPVRRAVVQRCKAGQARGELTRAAPAERLAELLLASVLAALLSWSREPAAPLHEALAAAGKLLLEGARAKGATSRPRLR